MITDCEKLSKVDCFKCIISDSYIAITGQHHTQNGLKPDGDLLVSHTP